MMIAKKNMQTIKFPTEEKNIHIECIPTSTICDHSNKIGSEQVVFLVLTFQNHEIITQQ